LFASVQRELSYHGQLLAGRPSRAHAGTRFSISADGLQVGRIPGQNDLVIRRSRDIAATCEASNRRRGRQTDRHLGQRDLRERASGQRGGPTAGRSHPVWSQLRKHFCSSSNFLTAATAAALAGAVDESATLCSHRRRQHDRRIRSSCRSMRKMFPGADCSYPGPVRRSRHFAGRTSRPVWP